MHVFRNGARSASQQRAVAHRWLRALAPSAALLIAACAGTSNQPPADPQAACAALAAPIAEAQIGLPNRGASIDAATLVAASELSVAQRALTPAGAINPATPQYCKVVGRIAPVDASAPPILFQVNLPTRWNGRSLMYGGGGFNGTVTSGLGLPPAARFDSASPLARGYVTYGTDSGHQNQPGQPPQVFALNDEALVNFAHASYKKVHDVALELAKRRYRKAPEKRYFMGSSEGGREALTMAQRYPRDFDGVFARVPVINWTALQHAGTRASLAVSGEGWIRPPQIKLVHDAVLAACDAADGAADGIVSDHEGCRSRFDATKLRCAAGASGDTCLSDAQVRAVQTLHSPYTFDFPLANGVTSYPGWPLGGENAPGPFAVGGWGPWWAGSTPNALPPVPGNGMQWVFGGGALQYFMARDAKMDVRGYTPAAHAERVRQISSLMDSTNPDLSAFNARGGKLVMLEHMADYAQSPYAGIEYYKSVVARLGQSTVDQFARLYVAPGVDHVGIGAPANVDMLDVLADWVERGKAPGPLEVVTQQRGAPFAVTAARPLCRWPMYPRYKGSGDMAAAASFECVAR